MAIRPTRRSFLRSAPLAAAATLSLAEQPLRALSSGQATVAAPEPLKLFTAADLQQTAKTLGNTTIYQPHPVPATIIVTNETNKSAAEFEYHEGRDHIIQIVDGSTKYEVGGTPQGGHSTGPGEWLAPTSEGHVTYILKKGDMLVLPRRTPHKRSTEGSVILTIISSTGPAPAQ